MRSAQPGTKAQAETSRALGYTCRTSSCLLRASGKRVMPSYIMTGGNIQIEKSKVQNDRRGRRGDDRAHRSLEAPPQQAARESSGLDMHRIAPKLRLRRKLRNHSLPVHAPDGIIHVFKYIDRNSHEALH